MKCEPQTTLVSIGNSPQGLALTGAGGNQRTAASTHRSGLCVEQGLYMSFRSPSDRVVTG